MKQVCRAFPDMPNAEELFGKLLQHKDNHIFRGLATIATLGISHQHQHLPSSQVTKQHYGSELMCMQIPCTM